MINLVEAAIIRRLSLGLGELVAGVHSYGGEMDDEGIFQVAVQLPAAWVAFGGCKSETFSTARNKDKVFADFAVIVAATAARSEAASRHGGTSHWEIGSYDLVYGVRRLLSRQDFGLAIDPLTPKAVRPLFTPQREVGRALSVLACEFTTHWIETALPHGAWPEVDNGQAVDAADDILLRYRGQTQAATWLEAVGTHLHRPAADDEERLKSHINLRKP